MDFETYYQELKSCSSELLRERVTNEEYREEYRQACRKILEERACGTQQEPSFEEDKTEEELLCDLNREFLYSLDECLKPDKISEALHNLSDSVKKLGYVLLVILILTGVVLSVMGSFITYTELEGPLYDQYEVTKDIFDVGIFCTNILSWVIYAVVEYWVCKVISLLLTALASIVRSNRITSNVALYNANKEK